MRTSLRATVVAAATALMVLAGALGARDASTAENLSDPEFFGLLDYGVAGLSQVQATVQKGDYAAAKRELLAYYRARPANHAGKFTHKDWPGVLELTPDHIWTLGSGETYLTTVRFGAPGSGGQC